MNKLLTALLLTTSGLVPAGAALAQSSGTDTTNNVNVLSGFSRLWTTGKTWDTGTPTTLGAPILQRNLQIVVDKARARTRDQEIAAYYDDRRNQSYGVIDGLGPLTGAFKTGAGATTTIPVFDATTSTVKYDDQGTGIGVSGSALGKVVDLVNGLRNANASTTPAKNFYNYPRPWRQTLNGQSLDFVVVPSLVPAKGTNPSSDGGFPSGHTNAAVLTALALAQAVPQRFQELLTRASELGDNRVVAGMHSPLDVMGARVLATFTAIRYFNDPASASLRVDALAQAQSYLTQSCGGLLSVCAHAAVDTATDRFSDYARNKADYTARLTYGFAPVGPTDLAPVVPTGAEVLLETRFPYLSAAQRRDVLASTELASGGLLDNGLGYDRLNLFAAADGYGSLSGTVTVTMEAAKGGFSAFDTWRNDIGGNGGLVKAGSGTLVLTGANTYAGGTTIAGGTLIGHALAFGSGTITDNAALIIDQSIDGTMANAIAGTGTLTKINRGNLILTGQSTLTGPTGVAAGGLVVNGSLAGSVVTVASGAFLGGTGTVGGVIAQSGATVAPGNSIGTLTVAGNVSFAAGSTVQVEANAAGQADRLAASGSATLAGGTVQVVAQNGSYQPRTLYPILTAAGGVSGRFDSVSSNLAFLTPTLRYQAGEVDLTLTRNDIPFATIAQSRNQAAVATAIQAAGSGAIYDRTIGLTTPEAVAAFQATTGDIHASSVSAAYETAFFVREAILDRLRWGASGGRDYGSLPATYTADLPGRAKPVPVRVLDPQVFALWGQGFGAFGRTRSDGNAASLDRDTAGFVLGGDVRLENGITLGVAGGYTTTSLDTAGRLQTGTIESGFGGVYGGTAVGPLSLRLGAVYAGNSLRLRRTVSAPGVAETESARYGGSTLQGFGEIGYRIVLGTPSKDPLALPTYLEPFVGGAYVGIDRDRFAETGGVAALSGASRLAETPTFTAGVRGQTSLDLGFGAPVSLHGLVGYRRAFGDVIPTALVAFGTGPSFVTAGLPISRDALVAQAGLDLQVSSSTTLGVSYTGQVGTRAEDHAVKGSFTYRF
ncbi:autotransporter domain-containing protein [Methylobacterium sp. ID0610]|uniref:autotransporter domain-containing protein n=1 Tax=Methylobacterium carpenticola TaxID=3344827 RepID=UPI0036C51D9B